MNSIGWSFVPLDIFILGHNTAFNETNTEIPRTSKKRAICFRCFSSIIILTSLLQRNNNKSMEFPLFLGSFKCQINLTTSIFHRHNYLQRRFYTKFISLLSPRNLLGRLLEKNIFMARGMNKKMDEILQTLFTSLFFSTLWESLSPHLCTLEHEIFIMFSVLFIS